MTAANDRSDLSDPTNLSDRAGRAADQAADNPWTERLGRMGLTARGVVYCIVAVVAVQVATGRRGQADRKGALQTIAHQPFGRVLLVALAVGFAGYAAWRFVKAAVGAGEGSGKRDDDASGIAKRVADVGKGLIYVVAFVTTVKIIAGRGGSGGSNNRERSFTAKLLAHSYGPWLVGAIGVALIAGGAVLAWRGAKQKFNKNLELGEMSGWQRTWLPRLGTFGHAARGVVLALIGVFLIQAAVDFDPAKAVGVDGALKKLAHRAYGPWMLALVALGLAAFGLFSFVEARYRKVLDDF